MIIEGKEFKRYNDNYYVSEYGDVYSVRSKKLMNPMLRGCGNKLYRYIDIKGRHTQVHRMVYEAWIGKLPEGMQVNHKDDDPLNNHYSNLYAGTQKENIRDCIKNNHRCGNRFHIIVLNKQTGQLEYYDMAKDFLETTGHSVTNGSITKVLGRKWFNEKYELIKMERCRDHRKSIIPKVDK